MRLGEGIFYPRWLHIRNVVKYQTIESRRDRNGRRWWQLAHGNARGRCNGNGFSGVVLVPPRVHTATSWAQAHTPYTRVSVANEHKAGSSGEAPEENCGFVQFIQESSVPLRRWFPAFEI